jgi:hypothetical protein
VARKFLLLLRVLAARAFVRLAGYSLLAAAALHHILRQAGSGNEFRDAQYHQLYENVAVHSLLEYAQVPLWNPYYCGGMYALGAPQTRYASPTFLLSLLFGADRAQFAIAYLMLVIGMEGFYRFFSVRSTSALGPALAAPLIGLNGLFITALFKGWIHFYGFALLPWLFWGIHRAVRRDPISLIAVPVSFAWMIGFGITYAPLLGALYGAVELVWELGTHAKERIRLVERVLWVGAAGVLGLGLSMFRLWPVAETMAQAQRIMAGAPGNSWTELGHAVFSQAVPRGGNLEGAGTFFFGVSALPLVALGLLRPRLWPAAILAAVSVWAATGYAYGAGPFVWLRELPTFAFTRYPERFSWFACLYATILAVGGVDLLVRIGHRWRFGWLGVLAAIGLFVGSYAASVKNFRAGLAGMWLAPPPPVVDEPFAQARGNRWLARYGETLGRGTLSCHEAYPMEQSDKLRGDLPQEEYLADPTAGSVSRAFWSPNRIDLRAELTRPARVLVNQNWHPGWRASVGRAVSEGGIIGVDLPPGHHELVLRFVPRSAVGGAVTSLVALCGLVVLFRRARRGTGIFDPAELKGTLLSALGPLVVVLGMRVLVPESPALPPVLLNANRTPVLVDELPAGATGLGADFEVPVRLEGALLPRSVSATGVGSFELFWRVTGKVPRSVGVFVQLEGPDGHRIHADHEVVGSSVFFGNAPRNQLLRDAFGVDLSVAPRGEWRVHVGLWNASGNHQRLQVRVPGELGSNDNRVAVGTFILK